jgi:hypothetical protein
MALNIPSSRTLGFGDFTTGLNTGANLFNSLMNPKLKREEMAQADIHHKNNLGFKMQQLEQQALHHKQNYGMALEQLQMAKDEAPWKRKELEARANYHQAKMDDITNTQNLINQYFNTGEFNAPDQGMPTQPSVMGATPQGGMQPDSQQVQPPSMEQVQQGFGKRPKVHPVIAAAIEKKFGYNPNKPTEEEKSEQRMGEFFAKEKYKAEQKGNVDLTNITPATRTKYQDVIREVNSIMPIMKELVEQGGESYTGLGTAADKKYLGKVKRIADVYMKAKKWPNTDKARNDAIELFKKGWSESPEQYKSRMQELEAELNHEAQLATNALKGGKSEVDKNESDPLGIL